MRYLTIIIALAFGCKKESQTPELIKPNAFMHMVWPFIVSDDQAKDLLDPSQPASYKNDDISVFSDGDLVNEITSKALIQNDTGGVLHGPNEQGYMLTVVAAKQKKVCETLYACEYYLKLSSNDVDTIVFEIAVSGNGEYIRNVTYNGIAMPVDDAVVVK